MEKDFSDGVFSMKAKLLEKRYVPVFRIRYPSEVTHQNYLIFDYISFGLITF